MKKIALIGGSGFLGKEIAKKLLRDNNIVSIISRTPNVKELKLNSSPGMVNAIACDISNKESLIKIVKGFDIVINLVGILFEKKKSDFNKYHYEGIKNIVEVVKLNNIKQFIHISAIGADINSPSKYAKSKALAENYIKNNLPNYCILRPSVIFGENDNFFNKFNSMSKFSPFLPLIYGGKTRFQPVYVKDVADAVLKTININYSGTLELGGSDILNFKEILEYILKTNARNRLLINLPVFILKILTIFSKFLPEPIITSDQLKLLRKDNIVTSDKNFSTIAIDPRSIDEIVPLYLNKL